MMKLTQWETDQLELEKREAQSRSIEHPATAIRVMITGWASPYIEVEIYSPVNGEKRGGILLYPDSARQLANWLHELADQKAPHQLKPTPAPDDVK